MPDTQQPNRTSKGKKIQAAITWGTVAISIALSLGTLARLHTTTFLSDPPIIIQDSEDLQQHIRKPLEGEWNTTMTYTKFGGKEGLWIAKGKAFIIWKPGENPHYAALYGAGLKQKRANPTETVDDNTLVTWALRLKIDSDKNGNIPKEPSKVNFIYTARTGVDRLQIGSGFVDGEFEKLKVTKYSPTTNKPIKLTAELNGKHTTGKLFFEKVK